MKLYARTWRWQRGSDGKNDIDDLSVQVWVRAVRATCKRDPAGDRRGFALVVIGISS